MRRHIVSCPRKSDQRIPSVRVEGLSSRLFMIGLLGLERKSFAYKVDRSLIQAFVDSSRTEVRVS